MNYKPENEFYVEETLIDFRGILKEIFEYWKVIFATSVVFGLVSIPFSFSLTEYYRAEILMTPAQDTNSSALSSLRGQLGGLSSFIGGLPVSSAEMNVYTSLAILNSRTFTDIFIQEKDILPQLFPEKWDDTKGDWKSNPPTKASADLLFKKMRFTNYDNQENLITFAIEWTDPAIAAKWANEYIELLNDYIRKQAVVEAESSISFLQNKLDQTSVVDLRTILYGMIEQQTQTVMLGDSRKEYAFKIIDAAVVPDERVRPNKTFILIFATFAGFSLGLFYAVFSIYTLPLIKDVIGIKETEPLIDIDSIPIINKVLKKIK
tara:strand:- start:107 stop:1066 length:960 start_codon:yes stop_codon:yes gene_type:complete